MQLPRFLWVPFELGRPFGAPNEPEFQRRVLHDALALLERTDGPVVLADFPDDAPSSEDDVPWACPVSFAPPTTDEPGLLASVRAEVARLAPWAELGSAPSRHSDHNLDGMIALLGDIVEHGPDETVDIEALRLVADDLRTWYLHAVSQQPGTAGSHDRNAWFWRQTALAHLLGQVAATLVVHHDPLVRMFAARGLVPRDHWDVLVPETPEETTDA